MFISFHLFYTFSFLSIRMFRKLPQNATIHCASKVSPTNIPIHTEWGISHTRVPHPLGTFLGETHVRKRSKPVESVKRSDHQI